MFNGMSIRLDRIVDMTMIPTFLFVKPTQLESISNPMSKVKDWNVNVGGY